MTRAIDELVMTSHRNSEFSERIQAALTMGTGKAMEERNSYLVKAQ